MILRGFCQVCTLSVTLCPQSGIELQARVRNSAGFALVHGREVRPPYNRRAVFTAYSDPFIATAAESRDSMSRLCRVNLKGANF